MRLTPERLFLWVVVGAYVALAAAFAPRAPVPFFRPWERMLHGATDDRFVKYGAVTLPTCGDLSYNLCDPRRQVWRTTTFTTDVVGLRNAPLRAPPRVVVVGDSFVVGANLDDRETINVALARRLGETVYNHGSEFPGSELQRFFTDPRFSRWTPSYCPTGHRSRNSVQWAALVAWIATALGGLALFALWLRHGGLGQDEGIRATRLLPHLTIAVVGLAPSKPRILPHCRPAAPRV